MLYQNRVRKPPESYKCHFQGSILYSIIDSWKLHIKVLGFEVDLDEFLGSSCEFAEKYLLKTTERLLGSFDIRVRIKENDLGYYYYRINVST